jgi:hypothetical protein
MTETINGVIVRPPHPHNCEEIKESQSNSSVLFDDNMPQQQDNEKE